MYQKGRERGRKVYRWHSCSESKAGYEDLQKKKKEFYCLLLIGGKIAEVIQCQSIKYNTHGEK